MDQPERSKRAAVSYDWRLVRWIWGFIRPYRALFIASVILMPLNTAFSLAQPYMIKLTCSSRRARDMRRRDGSRRWCTALARTDWR
jgi:ABC-type multidrug transport system fused ATPase/permease subunit